jgi:hypothetical protein
MLRPGHSFASLDQPLRRPDPADSPCHPGATQPPDPGKPSGADQEVDRRITDLKSNRDKGPPSLATEDNDCTTRLDPVAEEQETENSRPWNGYQASRETVDQLMEEIAHVIQDTPLPPKGGSSGDMARYEFVRKQHAETLVSLHEQLNAAGKTLAAAGYSPFVRTRRHGRP